MNTTFTRHFPASALALCILLGLFACSSTSYESGTQISADKVAQIKKGITTRAEVEALLGPPAFVSMLPEGKRMMSYSYSSTKAEGHATAATYIPYVGIFAGGGRGEAQTRIQTLQIMLDAKGVVEDYDFADNTSNTAMKSGGLFGVANQSSTTTTTPTAPAEQK